MPLLLYLDTAANCTFVAVANNETVLAQRIIGDSKQQSAMLNGIIAAVLVDAGHTLNEIDGIAICAGPGSYTGLRIGLGVAKGIAFALDKPLMLFDRLTLIAFSNRAVVGSRSCLVVLRARTAEFFIAHFDRDQSLILSPRHIFEDQLLEQFRAPDDCILCITDDHSLSLPLEKYYLPDDFVPDPQQWAVIAVSRMLRKEWDDLAYCEPLYLKEAFTTRPKKWKI